MIKFLIAVTISKLYLAQVVVQPTCTPNTQVLVAAPCQGN